MRKIRVNSINRFGGFTIKFCSYLESKLIGLLFIESALLRKSVLFVRQLNV